MCSSSNLARLSHILVSWRSSLGCIGAIIGGGLFELLGVFPGLEKVSISVRDILAAFTGSVIILAAVWAYQRRNKDLL